MKFDITLVLGPEGRRFKSCLPYHCLIVQLVEHATVNRDVTGSSPVGTAILTTGEIGNTQDFDSCIL